jgi:AraC family transcriptional regulator
MAPIFQSGSVAQGLGWQICEEVCRAGPSDRSFEERHNRFSVSAVLSGTFVYHGAAGRALMSPGSVLIGRQGSEFTCSHEYSCGDRCVAFYFDESWIDDLAGEIPGVKSIAMPHPRIPPAQALAPLIADVQAFADNLDTRSAEELAMRMAHAALTFFSPAASQVRDVSRADERRIAALLGQLDEKIADSLCIDHMAATVGMSRYHFLRTFRRVMGQTPWQFILSRRLTLAARHLAVGRGTVLDAAVASGFNDPSEFTRQFRRQFGVTPGVYRRSSSGQPRSV